MRDLAILVSCCFASTALADLVATAETGPTERFQTLFRGEGPVTTFSTFTTHEATAQTGTVTLSSDESQVTFSGIGLTRPAHTYTLVIDTITITFNVDALTISQNSDVTVPVLSNMGNSLTTAGFDRTTFLDVSNDISGTWSAVGPLAGMEGGSFSFAAQQPATPFGENMTVVARNGSPINGSVAEFRMEEGIRFHSAGINNELFDGTIDGIPLRLTYQSANGDYDVASPIAIPEASQFATGLLLLVAVVVSKLGWHRFSRFSPR